MKIAGLGQSGPMWTLVSVCLCVLQKTSQLDQVDILPLSGLGYTSRFLRRIYNLSHAVFNFHVRNLRERECNGRQ